MWQMYFEQWTSWVCTTREDTHCYIICQNATEHVLDRIGLGELPLSTVWKEVDKWLYVGNGQHPSAIDIYVLFLLLCEQRDTVK